MNLKIMLCLCISEVFNSAYIVFDYLIVIYASMGLDLIIL